MSRVIQKSGRKPTAKEIDLGSGGEQMQQGLAKLTLSVMEILRRVLERQAMRRIDSGTLSEEEVERMGVAFMNLRSEMAHLTKDLGLRTTELDEMLDSLLKTKGVADNGSLVDFLDRLLERGAVVAGQIKVSVADVDLIGVDLLAMLYPIYGHRPWLDGGPVSPK